MRVSPGSITTDTAGRGDSRPRWRRLGRPHRIEQFRARDKHHAGAYDRQQKPGVSRIDIHIMAAALDRADRDRVNHRERLEPGLDGEQSGETLHNDHG